MSEPGMPQVARSAFAAALRLGSTFGIAQKQPEIPWPAEVKGFVPGTPPSSCRSATPIHGLHEVNPAGVFPGHDELRAQDAIRAHQHPRPRQDRKREGLVVAVADARAGRAARRERHVGDRREVHGAGQPGAGQFHGRAGRRVQVARQDSEPLRRDLQPASAGAFGEHVNNVGMRDGAPRVRGVGRSDGRQVMAADFVSV